MDYFKIEEFHSKSNWIVHDVDRKAQGPGAHITIEKGFQNRDSVLLSQPSTNHSYTLPQPWQQHDGSIRQGHNSYTYLSIAPDQQLPALDILANLEEPVRNQSISPRPSMIANNSIMQDDVDILPVELTPMHIHALHTPQSNYGRGSNRSYIGGAGTTTAAARFASVDKKLRAVSKLQRLAQQQQSVHRPI